MKPLFAFALNFLFSQLLCQSTLSENTAEFDSLKLVIRPCSLFVFEESDGVQSTLKNEVFRDVMNLDFSGLVQKHGLDSVAQEEVLSSLSVSAQICEAMRKLEEETEKIMASIDTSTSAVHQQFTIEVTAQEQEILDSLEKVVWECEKVKRHIEEVKKISEGKRKLVGHMEEFEGTFHYKMVEDNGVSFVTHLWFVFSPNNVDPYKISFYDTLNDRRIDFGEWSKME